MKNLFVEKLFSTQTNLEEKKRIVNLLITFPHAYQAESISDLKNNLDKITSPFYKIRKYSKYKYKTKKWEKILEEEYNFSCGGIILVNNLWADLIKETEYKSVLSTRDFKDSLEVNVVDFRKLNEDRIDRFNFYYDTSPKEDNSFFQAFEKSNKFKQEQLDGLMPPKMICNIEKLKGDFHKTNFIGTLYTFYNLRDKII